MNQQKRRFVERNGASPTFIGAQTVVVGNVRGRGQFVVSGEVQGDGTIDGALNLAVGGHWQGDITATHAVIAGTIIGSLMVGEKLEIGQTAIIRGRVSARSVAIARGAIVDGEIEVTSGKDVVQFDEKRTGSPGISG